MQAGGFTEFALRLAPTAPAVGGGDEFDITPITTAIAETEATLLTELASIAADAVVARQGVVNDAKVNELDNTATIYEDDQITPLAVFDLIPNAKKPLIRRRRN